MHAPLKSASSCMGNVSITSLSIVVICPRRNPEHTAVQIIVPVDQKARRYCLGANPQVHQYKASVSSFTVVLAWKLAEADED